jgi:transcriptional regulator of acetoin/glycerol metabolism
VLHPEAPAWHMAMLDDEMRMPTRVATLADEASPDTSGPPSRDELLALLERCHGNVSRVARLVQRSRKQVYRWINRHGLALGSGRIHH